jgi:hypothetical protein
MLAGLGGLFYPLTISSDVKTARDKKAFIAYCRQEVFPLDARNADMQESFMKTFNPEKEAEEISQSQPGDYTLPLDTRPEVPCGSRCSVPVASLTGAIEGDGYHGYLTVVWTLAQALGISRASLENQVCKLGKILEKSIGIDTLRDSGYLPDIIETPYVPPEKVKRPHVKPPPGPPILPVRSQS